jgi:hypothetical protein
MNKFTLKNGEHVQPKESEASFLKEVYITLNLDYKKN